LGNGKEHWIASIGDLLWIGFALDARGDHGGFGRFDVEAGKVHISHASGIAGVGRGAAHQPAL